MSSFSARGLPFPSAGNTAVFGVEVADLGGSHELVVTLRHRDGDDDPWELFGTIPVRLAPSLALGRMTGIGRSVVCEIDAIGPAEGPPPRFRILEPAWSREGAAPGPEERPRGPLPGGRREIQTDPHPESGGDRR